MFLGPKVVTQHAYYNFHPKQLYLVETEKAKLAIRAEWFNNGFKRRDYAITAAEPIAAPLLALEQKQCNIKWHLTVARGCLSFTFQKPSPNKRPSYRGRMVYRYLGVLPVSVMYFCAKDSSISALLHDIQAQLISP